MSVHVGDKLRLESERAGQTGREGVIEEVLSEEPPRLRVRWNDGRTSIFVPASGVARIEAGSPAKRRAKKGA